MQSPLHPIVAQLQPSSEQLPAIAARGSDVAVTAGAGAGKTLTLVARYLALLGEGLELRKVVAITFTRKAAREMRNRVRETVRRYLETPALPAEERDIWRSLYTELDAARIGTIHSLCAEILRHHPAEAAIDPGFNTLDEGQQALLQRQAVDTALGHAADDPQMARLFGDFGESALRRALSALFKQSLDVNTARMQSPDDLWSVWEAQITPPMRAFLSNPETQAALAELQALADGDSLARAEAAGDAFAPLLQEICVHWNTIQKALAVGDWITISQHLYPLRDALKQKGRKDAWKPADPRLLVKTVQEAFDAQLGAWARQPFDLAWDREIACRILPALLGLYDIAQAQYNQAKATRRALDFDDLEAGALRLLQNNPEVRAYWQNEIAALLIDEFQDTNMRQRQLLEALNGDGGQLFIVGDGKQSIYRFRGADVTVFRDVWKAIAQDGQTLTLATSYRAHAALIAGLNALLAPVLGTEDPNRPYVEPFAPLQPHRQQSLQGLQPPFIEAHLVAGSKGEGALVRAAQVLVNRLQALVASDVTIEESNPETGRREQRPLDYGDIAILCRASASFAAYEDALEAAGIPFLTVAGRGFYERPEVRDVLNALQAIAAPADDLALAGLLRSPVSGISDMTLYELRQAQKAARLPSLWAALNLEDLAFLGEARASAIIVRDLVARLHTMAGRVPVADVLKAFLDATDYRAALLVAGQWRSSGNLVKLLADAHASEIVNVEAFLEYVQQLRDAGTREGEARSVARGVVQLFTVHAAKGLEFPIVVLGDITRESPVTRETLLDPQLGIVPSLPAKREDQDIKSAAYALAQERAADQEAAESNRLLYVAATRAQEILIFSGALAKGKTHWLARLPLTLPDPTCNPAHPEPVILEVDGTPLACYCYPEAIEVPIRRAAPAQSPFPVTFPEALPLLLPLHTRAQNGNITMDSAAEAALQDPPPRVWRVVPASARVAAPAWVVGQIVHGALERWLFPGKDSEAMFYRWAEAEIRNCGITDEDELVNAIQRAARMLSRFQATPLYEAMAGATRQFHEVPYSLLTTSGLEQGVMDALFETADDWTLVEFKTDALRNETALQLRLADYIPQVERYMQAAERLLGVRPHPVLCFLNVGGTIKVIEGQWG